MKKQELLPCPFCGNDNEIDIIKMARGGIPWIVVCHNCGSTGADKYTEKSAIKAWNTRNKKTIDKIEEKIKSHIGHTKDAEYWYKCGLFDAMGILKGVTYEK